MPRRLDKYPHRGIIADHEIPGKQPVLGTKVRQTGDSEACTTANLGLLINQRLMGGSGWV
jgi:hypothetical protein